MATRAQINAYIDKPHGSRVTVFSREYKNLKEIQDAVEQAFDEGATVIVITRIMPSKLKKRD